MKPNIVILSTFISPFRSGAEACAEEVAFALADTYNVTIVCCRFQKQFASREQQHGITIRRVGFGVYIDKWLYPLLALWAVGKEKPHAIHAILESLPGITLLLCKWMYRVPTILTCQSTNTRYRSRWSWEWLVRYFHKKIDIITVISKALQQRAATFDRNDAILIPNGLRVADIPQRKKVPGRILYAGRLQPQKGIDTLLHALAQLPEHIHLHIIGRGPLKAELRALARTLNIENRVTFLGFVPVPDAYNEFADAEVFCGLSRSEAFGNVFIEAQAAGCAVVGTNIGGIPDTVSDGKTGLLVPPDNADAAAAALRRYFEDDALRNQLSQAGIANAQTYDWSTIAKQYSKVYQQALIPSTKPTPQP